MTGWRINQGPMTDADCHRNHRSTLWSGGCDGDDAERSGVSCCRTLGDLVAYFASGDPGCRTGRNARFGGAYLVQIEGKPSDDEPWDEGELLLHPTAVLSCEPVAATSFLADLAERLNAACGRDERVVYDSDRGEMAAEDWCDACDGAGRDEDGKECWECDGAGWIR